MTAAPAPAGEDGSGAAVADVPRAAGASAPRPGGPGPEHSLDGRLRNLLADGERRLVADEQWLCLFAPHPWASELPAHGWKLHVSARPEDLSRVADLVVPVLLRYVCDAKFARDAAVLGLMNSGALDAALVGKAVTVYPRPQDVTALGGELANLLAGWPGPRVLSDRQIRSDAPVYYRYGPFRATGTDDAALVMTGPDGARFRGRAGTRYRQPPWTADPFRAATPPAARSARLIGGRYRLTTGISRSPHGDVYRAVDTDSGERVIVKQARAYVGEGPDGVDARGRLRHEHAVLRALAGVEGVPQVRDHLRHGDDEYLITTDCGPRDLRRDVLGHGPYAPAAEPAPAATGTVGATANHREIATLARRLLAVLDAVHTRGIVVGDLKPSNVVLGEDNTAHLVDFGVSALHGDRPTGATPGYSMPVYRAGEPPAPADDLYALGATLHFALTGMDPVVVDRDEAVNRERTLACLAAVLPGAAHRSVRELVAGLLDPDPLRRAACARRWRGQPTPPATGRRLPSPRRITRGLLDDLIAHTVATCATAAGELPAGPQPRHGQLHFGLTLYDGAAGVGLELLHHLEHPGVPQAVAGLAHRTARHTALPTLTAALYTGRTGVDLFLDAAAELTGTAEAFVPPPSLRPYDDTGDQIGGAAGVGSGLLALARRAYAAGRDEKARARLAAAGECVRTLLAAEDGRERAEPQRSAAASEAAFPFGFAHGRAGVIHFLHAYHRLTGDPAAGAAARSGLAELAVHTPHLLALAARPEAHRRYGSWCRGLAGIGTLLIEAGGHEGDPRLTDLGVRCAWACRDLAPRMSPVSQCCGLAGVGELLIDAEAVTGDGKLHRAAEDVVGLILARSGGTLRRPLFPDNTLAASGPGWATGSAGVLSLLRRLRDHGGPRLWSDSAPAPAQPLSGH
ncbi:class IV lanthionine synthetase LanL [Streptomyces sp. BPTC-684]|uniref:class IV lanthionine synthetase LanL n=1 Tax=Streptomyces sp. BPTC-684 TaxID=3043734 RepID=UPI0024B04F1E|nr:class IV lanthionine synthetase LanL [Streptomyces sp. BPTC-684]WHM40766.1 class IV lanthionine synthetase LanL [Streptomyces sp. BPTC-684]